MRLSLPSLSSIPQPQSEHDPWPPTYRLPSGGLRVKAIYKEPARQKLVDKATKAVAFLATMTVILGHAQWPFPELTTIILRTIGQNASPNLPELIAARLMIGVAIIIAFMLIFRLALAALGLDRGATTVTFEPDHILINGQAFDRRVTQSFDLEPHHLGKREDHRDRQHQINSPLYYRDSHIVMLQYGDRRIEIAEVLGRKQATKLVARLQTLQKTMIPAPRPTCETLQQQRA